MAVLLKQLAAVAFLGISSTAWAQTEGAAATAPAAAATSEAAAPVTAEPAAPPGATVRIPAGTVVQVEITEALSSETSQQEQLFALRLAEPIVIDGREIVPAGALGGGEVIDAHPSAFGGRQGRLIISGRFIEIGGQRVRIRSMQVGSAGEDRAGAALTVAVLVGVPALLVQGGEVHIPVGTRATARIAADVDVSPEPPAPAVAGGAATETTQQSSGGETQQ